MNINKSAGSSPFQRSIALLSKALKISHSIENQAEIQEILLHQIQSIRNCYGPYTPQFMILVNLYLLAFQMRVELEKLLISALTQFSDQFDQDLMNMINMNEG
ncbi:uncharacterized protein [Halyomorpha halys]|uniref:uncharacterized protein n=1 Tax=Halyomorpha halys TaxID=286706 RepID=UPI0006D4F93A|nr:uncharacterized protein LOC106689492 [Halyomorpha halys]